MLHTYHSAKLKRPENPAIPLNQNLQLFLDPQDPELLGDDISYVEYISKLRKKPKKKFQQPTRKEQPSPIETNNSDIYIPKATFHTFYYKDPSGNFLLI